MLFALLAGILRWPWWSPIIISIAGMLLDVAIGTSRRSWIEEAGLSSPSEQHVFFSILIAFAVNYAIYGAAYFVSTKIRAARRPADQPPN